MKVNPKIVFVLFAISLVGVKLIVEKDGDKINESSNNVKVEILESSPHSKSSFETSPQTEKIKKKTTGLSLVPTESKEPSEGLNEVPEYLEEFKEISLIHRKSLVLQMQTLSNYGKRKVDSEDLVSELEKQQLAPEIRVDKNPYTGNLNVVRTNKVLPGTRYFHAQFFEDEDGSEYIQHLSFEFKGSNQSFDAVEQTVLNIFKDSALVQNQKNENFRSWKRDDGYVIWMKKMDESDIQDNPFNVYTREDIGTIRVAIELDIHDHAPAFHAEQGSAEEE